MTENLFYCYSKKLSYFIRAFGIKYISVGLNTNTHVRYHVFEKSDRLDKVIALYNQVKHTV